MPDDKQRRLAPNFTPVWKAVLIILATFALGIFSGNLASDTLPKGLGTTLLICANVYLLVFHTLDIIHIRSRLMLLRVFVILVLIPSICYVSVTIGQSSPIEMLFAILATAHAAFLFSKIRLSRLIGLWYGLAVVLTLIALVGDSIGGTHRWLMVGHRYLNVAMLMAPSAVFILCVRPQSLWRGLASAFGVGLIAATSSFSIAFITATSCLVCLVIARLWSHVVIAIALIFVCALVPMVTSQNRLVRVVDFVNADSMPYQVQQARKCLRAARFVGTSEGIQYHLPASNDDFAIVDAIRRGGNVAALFVMSCSLMIIAMIAMSTMYPGSGSSILAPGAISLYAGFLLLNLCSNFTIIPPVGVSAPFVGSGMNNAIISGILVGSQLSLIRDPVPCRIHSIPRIMVIVGVIALLVAYCALAVGPLWYGHLK